MQQQLGEGSKKLRAAALQAPRRAGGARGAEQQLRAAQERPTEEQAVPPQTVGATQSRSPCAATKEPTVQQRMRPEGATAHGCPHRNSPGPELLPVGKACGGGAAPMRISLWEAHAGSAGEGWHPMGGTPCRAGAESGHEGAAEMKCGLAVAPIPLCCWGEEVGEGGMVGEMVLVCFNFSALVCY